MSLTLIGSRLSFDVEEQTQKIDILKVHFTKCDITLAKNNILNVLSNRNFEFFGIQNQSDLGVYRPYRPLSGRMFPFGIKTQKYKESTIINKGIGKEKLRRKFESNEIEDQRVYFDFNWVKLLKSLIF
jgi:hypothetical protein